MSRRAEPADAPRAALRGAALGLAFVLTACAGPSPTPAPSRAQQQAVASNERAGRLLARGDLAAARQGYGLALASARAVQDPALEAAALLNLALVHARLGDLAAAHAALDPVLAAPERFDAAVQARAAARKALLYLDERADADALRWADTASAACASPCALTAVLDTLRGQVAFAQGDLAGAAVLARRAIDAAITSALPAEEAGALRLWARTQTQRGDTGAAADALARAFEIDRQLGLPERLALDLVYAADNEDRRGNPKAAADFYQRALSVYDAIGDARNADALRQRLPARPAP